MVTQVEGARKKEQNHGFEFSELFADDVNLFSKWWKYDKVDTARRNATCELWQNYMLLFICRNDCYAIYISVQLIKFISIEKVDARI